MKIRLDVIERETGLPLDNREYPQDVITDFTAGAEWARKEALREAAEALAAAEGTSWELDGLERAEGMVRALAEGASA